MQEEIFGPVLTVYVYPDGEYEKTLDLCDRTLPYALTGAIFAHARDRIWRWKSCGTWPLHQRQADGGSGQPTTVWRLRLGHQSQDRQRRLVRWVSARTIKETFIPITDYRYPFMGERYSAEAVDVRELIAK